MEATEQKSGASLRWLLVGALSASPNGRRMVLTAADLPAALEAAKVSTRATVADRLGGDETRTYALNFSTFKSFQTNEVVAMVPTLRELQALGAALAQPDATKRPGADEAIAKVVALVGDGRLATSLRAKLGVAKSAPVAASAATAPTARDGDGVSLDDVLAAPAAPAVAAPTASSVIGSFIKASREATAPAATPPSAGRAARDMIETEVFATAVDILKESGVAALESAWRGVKMLVEACPSGSGMAVIALDAAPATAEAAVRDELAQTEQDENPDAIFVLDALDSVEAIGAWASVGADHEIPVVASVTHRFFGAAEPSQVAARIDSDDGGLPKEWSALRGDEATRWLAVVTNRVVLRLEGTGVLKRVVFGSPVAALAAMLATSYHRTGAFAQVVGEGVSMAAPASWELPSGRDAGMVLPTEAFFSASTQAALGTFGVVGFGSRRNSGNLVLSRVPTVRGGEDLIPLPAQLLTGRIVRFARWVLAQLPPKAPEPEVKLLFEQAASVFLFPAASEAARLEAQVVVPQEGGPRSVVLQVTAAPLLAGIMFHLGFSLPLPD